MPEIDWDFISGKEGKAWTQGYVPTSMGQYLGTEKYDATKHGAVLGKSGVTIATGFDIGQHNEWDLKSLGLALPLRAKLKPFLLLKKLEATKKLEEKSGLAIDADEAKQIDTAEKRKVIKHLQTRYNLKSAEKKKTLQFQQLPSEIQTAIASFAFNFGDNLDNEKEPAKTFWALVTDQDFEAAATLLEKQTFLAKRRKAEAALMRKGMPNVIAPKAQVGAPP